MVTVVDDIPQMPRKLQKFWCPAKVGQKDDPLDFEKSVISTSLAENIHPESNVFGMVQVDKSSENPLAEKL